MKLKFGPKTETLISSVEVNPEVTVGETFDFIIARPWHESNGPPGGYRRSAQLAIYMVRTKEIHSGTQEYANSMLEYVQEHSVSKEKWYIYRVSITEQSIPEEVKTNDEHNDTEPTI